MEVNAKLRLLNCTGYALRQGDDLQKIQTEIMEVAFIAPVAFILDDGGDIKCTVIKDKAKFEDETNIDRRVSNVNNSFNVLWDQDCRTCTIYRNERNASKYGMNSFPWIPGIISAVVGIGLGLLIGWISWGHSDSRPAVIDDSDQDFVVVREAVDTPVAEKAGEPAVTDDIAEAKDYIRKLHSKVCTKYTVHKVNQWWNNMSDIQKSALSEFKIPERIEAYYRFFEASNMEHIKRLIHYDRDIFSPYQQEIICVYGSNPRTFESLYRKYGMTFRIEPYDLGRVIGKVAEAEDTAVAVEAAPAYDAK